EVKTPRPLSLSGYNWRGDLSRRIEQFENTLAGSHGRLQNVVLLTQILNWPEEPQGVLAERNQHAQSRHTLEHAPAAKPDDGRDRGRRQNFNHRIIDRVRHDSVFERLHVRGIHVGELLEGALLAIEKL